MHESFSDWYRIANIEPTEETLEKRWRGIESIVSSLDTQSSLDLVRIFFGKLPKINAFQDTFKNPFKEADQTFRMTGNDLELQILAGVSIIQSLKANDNNNNIITAIATVCACFQEPATMPPFHDVTKIAEKHVVERSRDVRSRNKMAGMKTNIANLKEQKDALVAVIPQNSLPTAQEPMVALFDKIQQNITQIINKINKMTGEINDSLLLQQEETEMLWWLMGEYSTSLNKQISKIPLPFACLIVAKELSEHTQMVPGPISISALMDRMISTGRKNIKKDSSIKEVINKAPNDWKNQYLSNIELSTVEDLCPVHYAIAKSVETGDNTSWVASFEKNIGIKTDQSIALLDISMQAYNEMLLLRSIE